MNITRAVGDYAGWRTAARGLLTRHVHPAQVCWRDARDRQDSLFAFETGADADAAADTDANTRADGDTADAADHSDHPVRVARSFLSMAESVACHQSEARWDALYRVLFRLAHGEPSLFDVVTDPDVHRMVAMDKEVRRDVHKMHAFVRFRAIETNGETAYIAWFEPRHHIVERAVQLFVRRFASMRWSVLTPTASAHWDGQSLVIGAGVTRDAAPTGDALEELWRTYYAHIFNPARVAVQTMRAEMPMRYWHNLPEASLIPALRRDAPARVREMLARVDLPAATLPDEMVAMDAAPRTDSPAIERVVGPVFNDCHASYGTINADDTTGVLIESDKERQPDPATVAHGSRRLRPGITSKSQS